MDSPFVLNRWKQELELWNRKYGGAENILDKAEGLGAFQEICTRLG